VQKTVTILQLTPFSITRYNSKVSLATEMAFNGVLSMETTFFIKVLCISIATSRLSCAHGEEVSAPLQRILYRKRFEGILLPVGSSRSNKFCTDPEPGLTDTSRTSTCLQCSSILFIIVRHKSSILVRPWSTPGQTQMGTRKIAGVSLTVWHIAT